MAVAHLRRRRSFFLFMVFFILSPISHSVTTTESDALLKLKKSLTHTDSLRSWVPDSPPCGKTGINWEGLVCNKNGIVIGIHLGKMGLSGKIDVDALIQLPSLRTLYLANNTFFGSIPELNRLGALKAIYLSGNMFSGEIPADFFEKMESLKKIWLNHNNFSGKIPSSLSTLPNLIQLHLENNRFKGEIPPLNQPSLFSLNLSNNQLEGEIPANLSKFDAGSFMGNPGLCGGTLGTSCDQENTKLSVTNSIEEDNITMAVAMVTLCVMAFSIAIAVVLKRMRQEQKIYKVSGKNYPNGGVEVQVTELPTKQVDVIEKRREMDEIRRQSTVAAVSRKGSSTSSSRGKSGGGIGDLVIVNDVKGVFAMGDLMRATAEVMGNGGLGSTYKAVMGNGVVVAVKRMREMNGIGKGEFDEYVRMLGKLRHPNVLPLLGYHYRKDEKLLVSEFLPKGNLLNLLHGEHGPSNPNPNWQTRLKIVKGIARGLHYLHTELSSMDLPHGNLKSSNVLLNQDFEPLLVGYGFNHLLTTANAAQSLFAYKSPEATQPNHQISPKSDTFCLGILIIEILTGKLPSENLNNGKSELLDPEIAGSSFSIGEMEKLLRIGKYCCEINVDERLGLGDAMKMIEEVKSEGDEESRSIQLFPMDM